MITKIKSACFDGSRRRNIYPSDYYIGDIERPISHQQRKTLEELIYSRISNPDEIERRLTEIECYNFADASEAIADFLLAPWK